VISKTNLKLYPLLDLEVMVTYYMLKRKIPMMLMLLKRLNDIDKRDVYSEVEYLKKVDYMYVVKYFDSWREKDVVYIQLEMCAHNLTNMLGIKPQLFKRRSEETLNLYKYLISCEIFKEILECVEYLHEKQFIHRDLKPDNILIADNILNGRFIKLCDFGLVTKHDKIHDITMYKHTTDRGTIKYMAPEVAAGVKYDHKSDIYSVALIAGEIFGINVLNELDK
ncbi:unnamed protein product, partial [Oppiella nova]